MVIRFIAIIAVMFILEAKGRENKIWLVWIAFLLPIVATITACCLKKKEPVVTTTIVNLLDDDPAPSESTTSSTIE